MAAAPRFLHDVLHAFTWQKLLLVQLLVVALDIVAVLSFVRPMQPPPTFVWSRVVIEETMAFSVVLAVLAADQAVARGARPFQAFAIAIAAASVFAGAVQFPVRHGLGFYTNGDRPENDAAHRRIQMVYVGSDTLTYGGLFVLVYLDYRRRERLLRRVRAAELERARKEQQLALSKLAALRSDVDAEELLAALTGLKERFERDSPDAERGLDELIASLRAKLEAAQGPRDGA
ncbi:MAG TPA: hypothetical protein VFV10_02900 [Gammaproteobacteria bacterium]|nr:hypothetical protein [Gammaproteobacteria bacterium]